MPERRSYPLNQSRLYKITSPRKLAEVLQLDLSETESLAEDGRQLYQIHH